MNAHIGLQDQRSTKLQEGIDSILAMMKAKGADDWSKDSWGGKPKEAEPDL